MAERDFDEIREKLYDHEEPVEANLWAEIQASMRKRRLRKAFYYAFSSAAAVVLAFMLLTGPQRMTHSVEHLSEVAPVEKHMSFPLQQVAPHAEQQAETDMPQVPVAVEVVAQELPSAVEAVAAERTVAQTDMADEEDIAAAVAENIPVEVSVVGKSRQEVSFVEDEWKEEMPSQRKRYAMTFSGGVMPGSSAGVNGSSIMATSSMSGSHGYIIEQVSDTKYMLPLNLGVQLQFPVSENLALGVGVSYTMLKSKFDCLVNKVKYSGEQTLHYIGVPVNVYGTIAEKNRFIFYINAGAMLEKGIRAKYKFESYKDIHRNSTDMDGLLFSVNAGLGVEYKFSNYVGLYFEPNLIYFTNSDMQYSVRTDQPLQIKAELGCRFHF